MSNRQSFDSSQGTSQPENECEMRLLGLAEKPNEETVYTAPRPHRVLVDIVLVSLLSLCFIGAAILLFLTRAWAADVHPWKVEEFKSLITFGDSYTDERRGLYFYKHKDTAPPPGTLLQENTFSGSGGRMWPRYVVQYTGESKNGDWNPQMSLYNYAVGGSSCSHKITPKEFRHGGAYPSVLEYEVPAFQADRNTTRNNGKEPYFQPAITAFNAVFVMWTGTNDLGFDSFFTHEQVRGKIISDYTDCVYAALDGLYAAGARTFVLVNTVPLDLAPWYANETLLREGKGNFTAGAETIREFTTTVNTIFKYQTPYEIKVSKRYPDARIALFDVWSLFQEIYAHPDDYLNGTAPANVTHYQKLKGPNPDSFMWVDKLHPSEQVHRIVAKNFVQVLNGSSKYAQYW